MKGISGPGSTIGKASETILVVEDEDLARKNLVHILEKEGYQVISEDSGAKALEVLESRGVDLVITDLRMEKVDGMEVLRKTLELQPLTDVIMITGYATVDSAVKAIKQGAYYYIAKPYKIDEVRRVVREAILKRKQRLEGLELKQVGKGARTVPFIVGKSDAMVSVQDTVRQVAPSDVNVLILGETGTGKELIAKSIHLLSARSEKRFVAFNCGSFTEELMANELFGHEKGAFTGATGQKPGLLDIADGGTVFLDEIGDMPLSMQVKLLRVMQEGEFLRVGGVQPISVDLRFIAATHRDLKTEVEKGRFRQDLYYRINVVSIRIPPLAERREDIPLLAAHFLTQKSQALQKAIDRIETDALDLLGQYPWPGNVRELENVIERAVVLENGTALQVADLPEHIRMLSVETYRHRSEAVPTLEEQEIRYIRWVMEVCQGNKTRAAKMMGIDRVSLWRKLNRYKIA